MTPSHSDIEVAKEIEKLLLDMNVYPQKVKAVMPEILKIVGQVREKQIREDAHYATHTLIIGNGEIPCVWRNR